MTLSIQFLGAAGEVTGSAYRLEVDGRAWLVDCGMFQGHGAAAKNLAALDFDVRALAGVVLTHAHIDHSGLLPRLAARGFRRAIVATPATADLLSVMLPDAARIQESTSERAGDRGDDAVPPLYTVADAERALHLVERLPYAEARELQPGLSLTFRDAGHILGSAIAVLRVGAGDGARTLVFSGDLGQPGRPVLADPTRIAEADALVVESTYGDRLHRSLEATQDELAAVLAATLPHGNVVVPAFAVGRTQEVLYVLASLVRDGRAPPLEVFVDSPLATAATAITARYAALLDRESRDLMGWQARHRDRFRVHFTESVDDSKAINAIRSGAVIVAASGMCDAGRIRHHLRHNLGRPECAILFTGFQAAGTLGRSIVDGATAVRLGRDTVPVRASVHTIGGLSAHADQAALLDWLRGFARPPRQVFVVHGEAGTAVAFAQRIRADLGWTGVLLPEKGETRVVE